MGVEIGKVATPILANTGLAIGYGFWASIFEKLIPGFKSKEFTSPFKIPGFASGGVVPGSAGSPMLAMVHGGETITPAGGGGGGGGGLTFVYAPTFSLADAREVETKLRPMLDQWYQGARRRRV
jgi:hypothetical protein